MSGLLLFGICITTAVGIATWYGVYMTWKTWQDRKVLRHWKSPFIFALFMTLLGAAGWSFLLYATVTTPATERSIEEYKQTCVSQGGVPLHFEGQGWECWQNRISQRVG